LYNGFVIEYFDLSGKMPVERILLHLRVLFNGDLIKGELTFTIIVKV